MKTHYTRIAFLFVIVSFAGLTDSQAQLSKVGTTAADFMNMPLGARSSSMSAYTATVNDPTATLLNPAGLMAMDRNALLLEHTDWFMDMNHSFLGAAIPSGKGVWGLHILAMNYGEFEETTAEAQGRTGRTFNAYSASFGVSYARSLSKNLSLGATVRRIHEQIWNSSASTTLFDVGTLYKTPIPDITFGVSVSNVGGKLQMTGNDLIIGSDPDDSQEGNYNPDALLFTDKYAAPLVLRVGLEWAKKELFGNPSTNLTLTADGVAPSSNLQSISVGGELSLLNEVVFLRGGLPTIGLEDATQTFNFGLAIQAPDDLMPFSLQIGYAYHGYDYLPRVSKLSLLLEF